MLRRSEYDIEQQILNLKGRNLVFEIFEYPSVCASYPGFESLAYVRVFKTKKEVLLSLT